MDINITTNEIIKWFSSLLRTDLSEDSNSYLFSIPDLDINNNFKVDNNELEEIINKIKNFELSDETIIYNQTYFEILVREESRMPMMSRHKDEGLFQNDSDNGISYELSPPSKEYLIFLLKKISEIGPIEDFFRLFYSRSMLKRRIEDTGRTLTIYEIISNFIVRYPTLKIKSNKNMTIDSFNKHAMSYVFNLSYNSEYIVIPQRYLDDILRFRRIGRIRKTKIDEIDPPRRFYIPDLIYHYQMALSSESPYLEFISLFHIAEHFFESVFNDDIIASIRDQLTEPSFSYKRKKDIQLLIKNISKSVQFRNEQMIFNESEALKLTLIKYVNIQELRDKLNEFNPGLLDHYKKVKVPFSDGDLIDFFDSNDDLIYKSLSGRIYKTRNALVHSKESDKSKYTPFYDDKDLNPEIPLMRFISEMIIINNSKVIE